MSKHCSVIFYGTNINIYQEGKDMPFQGTFAMDFPVDSLSLRNECKEILRKPQPYTGHESFMLNFIYLLWKN